MNLQIKFIISVFLIVIFVFDISNGQAIQLYEYSQSESITNCTHGLVSDVDTVVFKAKIDNSEDINITHVYFQIKQKDEFVFWTFNIIDINHCDDDEKHTCTQIDTHAVLITIKVKAMKQLSGAKIKGVVIKSTMETITSDQQIFPEIADSTDMTSTVLINGVTIPKTNNSYLGYITGNITDFRFECESKVLPCLIQISANTLSKAVQGKSSINFIFRQKQLNITVKQALCRIDSKNSTKFNISIKGSLSDSEKEAGADDEGSECKSTELLIIIFMALESIALLFMLLIMRKKVYAFKSYFCGLCLNKNKKKNRGMRHTEESTTSNIEEKLPSNKVMNSKEKEQLLVEEKEKLQDTHQCRLSLKKNEATFKLDCQESKLFYLGKILEFGKDTENKSLEMVPKPDDAFPFREKPAMLNFKISNDLDFNAILYTENETNDKCQCLTCQLTKNPSTKWVKLSLIKLSSNTDVTVDLSQDQDNNQGSNDSKEILKRDKREKFNVFKCVTCDKELIDRIQRDLHDRIHDWSKVEEKVSAHPHATQLA